MPIFVLKEQNVMQHEVKKARLFVTDYKPPIDWNEVFPNKNMISKHETKMTEVEQNETALFWLITCIYVINVYVKLKT